nr:hypothetical protein Iba_chr11bCG5640 [Ipomoea batatas]GMD58666.1 hypothetical protein Iba_chr11fCG7760 [Ipomoea batatas]
MAFMKFGPKIAEVGGFSNPRSNFTSQSMSESAVFLGARWKSHLLDKSGRRGFTGGHVGRYKDGDGDFVGKFLHGERNGNSPVAMADQNNLFISGKRGHEVEERFHVLEHGGHLVDLFPVVPASGHVQRRNSVVAG